jgi:DNA polymerase-4
VERLWGVGRVTAAKLHARGIATVGEVAGLDEQVLVSMLGRASGRHLHALAHNRDPRVVRAGQRRGSIGSQQALGRRRRSRSDIDVVLLRLVDRITRRMRKAARVGRTVTLRFRFDDFARATRSHSLPQHTSSTRTVHATAAALLDAAWPLIERRGLTLLGVSVGNLRNAGAVQLTLPFERVGLIELEAALDAVRDRFGSASITRAGSIGTDAGFTVPMLPD